MAGDSSEITGDFFVILGYFFEITGDSFDGTCVIPQGISTGWLLATKTRRCATSDTGSCEIAGSTSLLSPPRHRVGGEHLRPVPSELDHGTPAGGATGPAGPARAPHVAEVT
jgi:hypothetical protein